MSPPPAPQTPIEVVLQNDIFTVERTDEQTLFRFVDHPKPDPSSPVTSTIIPLKSLARAYCPGGVPGKSIPAYRIYLALGKFRSTALASQRYNDLVASKAGRTDANDQPQGYERYVKLDALQIVSTLGYQLATPPTPVVVPGLDELLAAIEEVYKGEYTEYRQLLKESSVHYEFLHEYFVPGTYVSSVVSSLQGVRTLYLVKENRYEERKTLFGMEKSFHMKLEYCASLGRDFACIQFEEVFSGWVGSKTRQVHELPYVPADDNMMSYFAERGKRYVAFASGGTRFVAYKPGGLYLHHKPGSNTGIATAQTGPSTSGGRIMIDIERGAALGHRASQALDEATDAMQQLAVRYKRLMNDRTSASSSASDAILVFEHLPMQLQPLCWPALVGFSFTAKGWGHVLVDSLEEIQFNVDAFDQLVLATARKRLIKALVTFGDQQFEDIIEGKNGGSVFLLHGPPGCGKTLTAEAIAEVLQRPLYYIAVGELGTKPEEVESRLSALLDLCVGWNAIALIDEVDVFLEKRAPGDIVRSALASVMLRLLEYHRGILFLTTNRVRELDPAFESRITVALRYEQLDPTAREQVWRNLLGRVSAKPGEALAVDPNLDYGKLSRHSLNGRQIKNSVRLALALCQQDGLSVVTGDVIEETIAITSLGRDEMIKAEEY